MKQGILLVTMIYETIYYNQPELDLTLVFSTPRLWR